MENLLSLLEGYSSAAVFGHIRPDGDCMGAALAVLFYIRKNRPDMKVTCYLEEAKAVYHQLPGFTESRKVYDGTDPVELCLIVDCNDISRIGAGGDLCLKQAKHSICIDHHNVSGACAKENYIYPDRAAACEVLYEMMELSRMDLSVATWLYLGIIHDTGILRFSNVKKRTLLAVAELIDFGVRSDWIINETYANYSQKQLMVLKEVLERKEVFFDGKMNFAFFSFEDMTNLAITHMDLDGMVDVLRSVEGVEVAALLHESRKGAIKVSLRANYYVDVSRVCRELSGGGHIRAAGADTSLPIGELKEKLLSLVKEQI